MEPWFTLYKNLREAGKMTDAQLLTALNYNPPRITQEEYETLLAIVPST